MALSDNLISYWKLDEASGNALDAHGSNDLTETSGTIASTTGKVGNCRDFEYADSEYFTIADNADLSVGDIDFSLFGWFNAESLPETVFCVGKWNVDTNDREYTLLYSLVSNAFRFDVATSGSATAASAAWGSSASTATWYFVACGHNATSNDIWISVNNGSPVTTPHSGGVRNGTSNFVIGTRAGATTSGLWDGLIDEVAFFKRDIRSDLSSFYNSGSGISYETIIGGGATVSGPLIGGSLINSRRLFGGRLVA